MQNKEAERGQSLVELAMGLLLILIILSGVVDFGRLFYFYIAIRDAAQEGVTYASIHPGDDSLIIKRVKGSSDSPIDLNSLSDEQIEVTPTRAGVRCAGEKTELQNGTQVSVRNGITVRVTMNFNFITPVFSAFGNIPLSAEVTDTILTPLCS